MKFAMRFTPLLATLLLTACGGVNYSHHEAGDLMVVEGLVDNVVRSEIPNKKRIFSVTSVGFENGQGANLVGLYPGISRGKRVKITAEFMENVNGTDLFKVKQIIAVSAQGTTPTVQLPSPERTSPATTVTGEDGKATETLASPDTPH